MSIPLQKQPNRKRVQVTLSDEVWKLIEEVAKLTGQPKAALISELMDTAAPALVTMIEAVKLVNEAPREAQRLLSNFGAQTIRDFSQAQLDLDTSIDGRTVKGKRARRKGTDGPT